MHCKSVVLCESSIVRGEGVKPFVATWPINIGHGMPNLSKWSIPITVIPYVPCSRVYCVIANLFRDMANCTTRNVLAA